LRHLRAGFFSQVIQVEKQKIVLETGAGIAHGEATLLPREYGKIFPRPAG